MEIKTYIDGETFWTLLPLALGGVNATRWREKKWLYDFEDYFVDSRVRDAVREAMSYLIRDRVAVKEEG